MKTPTSLVLVVLAGWIVAAHGSSTPRFYQHIDSSDPAGEVAMLRTVGWSVRGYAPLPMQPPIDWAADPHADSNWRYQLNALYPLASVFLQLAGQYDPELHRYARAVFEDWVAFNLDQDVDHPFRWNDMATGIRATYLAQLLWYETCCSQGTDPARLRDAAVRHLVELADPVRLADTNHGLFQLIGIAALCEVLDVEPCSEAMRYAEAQYGLIFERQFNTEGMHLEHSPAYHLLALNAFDRIDRSGLLSLNGMDSEILARARRNLQYLIHPDGGFAEIGDTEASGSGGVARYDQQAAWLVTQGREGEPPNYGAFQFPETGLVSIRAKSPHGDSFLLFTTAHHSRAHKHLDTGSFEWSDRGVRLIVDSGKWGYDPGPERDYVLSPQAHNVLVTDGVRLSAGDVPEHLPDVGVESLDGLYLVEARLPAPRRLVDAEHTRLLLLNPGRWLIVADMIDEFLPSRQTQWFQFPSQTSLEKLTGGYLVEDIADPNVTVAVLPLWRYESIGAVRGVYSPLLGWYASEYRELRPSWQLGLESSGRNVRMATLFHWLEGESASPITETERTLPVGRTTNELRFCWAVDGVNHGVVLEREGRSWSVLGCDALENKG